MTKKISQLPAATSVDTNDEFVINQDGTTKKLTTANQWDFANVNIDGGTIDGTAVNATNLSYSGTLTGGTGVVNLGSGQVYKDASGNVGVGTASPDNRLNVKSDGTRTGITINGAASGDTAGILTLASSSGTTHGVLSGFSNSVVLRADEPSGVIRLGTGGVTDRVRIDSSGNVGIGTTSPAKRLDVNGEIRASNGILFGTDTAAANTLDDYEEGTWTPGFGATSGSFGALTFDPRVGYYTKIGNLVTVYGRINCNSTNIGTASGEFSINNLPFASANVSGDLVVAGSATKPGGAGPNIVGAYMIVNQTKFNVVDSNGNIVQISDLASGDRNDFAWTITYAV